MTGYIGMQYEGANSNHDENVKSAGCEIKGNVTLMCQTDG